MANETRALIGYTGFVGQTLIKQTAFTDFYRSTNISDIKGRRFDTIVCSGAPAVKWLANKEPEKDSQSIDLLIDCLKQVRCKKIILISTVDVFGDANGVDENTQVETQDLHPYGFNRYRLESFVRDNFDDHLIIRLPGLVGPRLKKNVIYDFLNQNNLNAIDSRGVFQFYPMVNLWSDIEVAINNNLDLIHLTSEPISVKEVAQEAFNMTFDNEVLSQPAKYDFQTRYGDIYLSKGNYQYTKKEVLLAIRAYAQSEQVTKS
ncbi:pyridine nucleotide transhydrogenase [Salinivibrio sp. ES.052]|uniref:pyridine nucleotide transhydrogenase n=1 Tax=Salinivibrio sp. ES.052 TaxID=1882823 RepID=UPI00092A6DAA|nr:pyridine nucleotide transhydrogenase [Salinivibrio sp. ES.052]SIN79718.1 hypothetical protein SAMN05444724_0513 [Salinivibrio sp. ES.052]